MLTRIGYHTRLASDDATIISKNIFGGDISIETANRLIHNHGFSVTSKPSGSLVFVDKEGNEVKLYFSINPAQTDIGREALMAWLRKNKDDDIKKEQEITALLASMSNDDILNKLRK